MKHSFLFFLTIATLFSCGSDTKPAQQSAAPALNFKTNSVPVPFAGSWISASYLNDIRLHQSPRKAQEGSEECFIQIPATTLLPATMVINFHEGLSDLVTISNNGAFQLWEKQGDTLSRAVYTIETLSADTVKIGEKRFIKINPERSGNQALILEEILFKGIYKSKQGEQVEFKANGEISGFGKYRFYEPVIDYFDAGLQIDQVALGEARDKMENFGFKFKKDRLELYALKCKTYDNVEKRCVEVAFGNKTIELEKVK